MTQSQLLLPAKWISLLLVVSLFVTSCAGVTTRVPPSSGPSQVSQQDPKPQASSQPLGLSLLNESLSFEPPQFLHKCILSAGDDRYCATEFEFRLFLHWLVRQEALVHTKMTDISEDRNVWKTRAEAAEKQQGLSIAGVMGVIGGIVAALGVGFGVGYGVSLVKGK